MKKLQVVSILILGILVICAATMGMASLHLANTYYVSNAANNGYALGSDSNDGLSRATPFLTIAKACSVSSSNGDLITVNPSGASYDENSGGLGHGLQLGPNGVTIQADPAVGQNATVTGLGSDRVVNLLATTNPQTLSGLTLDGSGIHQGITPHGSQLVLNQCIFQNIPSGSYAISAPTTNWSWTLNKCVVLSSVTDAFNIGVSTTSGLTYKGCVSSNSGKLIVGGGNATNVGSVLITTADDGTRNLVQGPNATFAYLSSGGAISNLVIEGTDLLGLRNGWFSDPTAGGSGISTYGTIRIDNNTINGSYSNSVPFHFSNIVCSSCEVYANTSSATGFLSITAELASNVSIHDNNITNIPSSTFDPIAVGPVGNGCSITNNFVSDQSTQETHAVLLGSDGPLVDSANIGASGSQELGDSSANTRIYQPFQTSSNTQPARSSTELGVSITLSTIGNPIGTLTAKIVRDNSGTPGPDVEISSTTLSATTISSNPTLYFFELPGHGTRTTNSTYGIELTYTGAPDPSNCIVLSTNSNPTIGSYSTSQDGTSWTTSSGKSILFRILTGCFAARSSQITGNTINMPVSGAPTNHGLICGCIENPLVTNNLVLGGGPTMPLKECYGGQWYDNLVWTSTGTQYPVTIKSSTNCTIAQCVGITTSPTAVSCVILETDQDLGANSILCSNNTIRNNIFIANPTAGNSYIYNATGMGTGNTIDNNCVFNGPHTQIAYPFGGTWASWQNAGYDIHSINRDPILRNEASPNRPQDFIPGAASPAANIGADMRSVVKTDFEGQPFSAQPWVGAFSPENWALQVRAATGETVYAVLRETGGTRVWNNKNKIWEQYSSANLQDYVLTGTPESTASKLYRMSFPPAVGPGTFCVDYRILASTSPSESDSVITDPLCSFVVCWNGHSVLNIIDALHGVARGNGS